MSKAGASKFGASKVGASKVWGGVGLALMIGLAAPAVAAPPLTLCAAMTLPPVIYLDKNLQPAGIDVAFGDRLAARLGRRVVWENVDFSGIIPALISQHCDAIVSALFIQPARLKVIDELPYMYISQSVLLKAGAPRLTNLDSLSGKKVAAVTGSATNIQLAKENAALGQAGKPSIRVVDFPTNSSALQALQFGQVDAFTVQYETAVYYAGLQPHDFEVGIAPFFRVPIGVGLRKGDPAEPAMIAAISAMRKDGSLNALLASYGLSSDGLDDDTLTK
jgi:polar amino acid transport system substrate-binding protein